MDNRKELNSKEIEIVKTKAVECIKEFLDSTIPYVHYDTEEPYVNKYTGKIGYDRSGDVRKANKKDILKIVNELGTWEYSRMCYENDFDEFISSLKTGNWSPSYQPGCGKNWDTFKEEIERNFNEWMYETFDVYDVETGDCNDDLECFIQGLFWDTYRDCSVEEYLPIVLDDLDEFLSKDNILTLSKLRYGFTMGDSDSIVDEVIALSNKICNLTGTKNLTVISSRGAEVVDIDENGLNNESISSTEDFYAYILSIASNDAGAIVLRQLIGSNGKDDIYKIYGIRLGNNKIEYLSSDEMKACHTIDAETGLPIPPEKNVKYSQLN